MKKATQCNQVMTKNYLMIAGGKRFVRRPVSWLIAGTVAASTAVLVSALASIPAQVFDTDILGDSIRRGPDLRVTSEIVNDDQEYNIVTPGQYELASSEPLLRQVDEDSARALMQRIRAVGGVDFMRLRLRLLLGGRRNQEIQIVDIGMTDTRRLPPVHGTLIYLREQNGHIDQQIIFNLNEKFPVARDPRGPSGELGDLYFKHNSISLKDREQIILLVQFDAKQGESAEFKLKVSYIIGDETRSLIIDNNGISFKVSEVNCRSDIPSYDYDHAYIMDATPSGSLALLANQDPHRLFPGPMDTTGCHR
jgi:hypothetical protein